MRFINWLLGVLGTLARGADAANGAGAGVPLDEGSAQAGRDADHQRRRDYRP